MTKPPYQYQAEIDDDETTAGEIARLMVQTIHPSSVVDFGCGLGNFVRAFQNMGVPKVLGLDGPWAQQDNLFKLKDPSVFQEADLRSRIELPQEFDLALCLEVAEHLPAESSDMLVQNLVRASKRILFSAAVPGQGGINHVNEQWIDYWEAKFLERGYRMYDIIRPAIWNLEGIKWWYRQNTYLFVQEHTSIDLKLFQSFYSKEPIHYLHPGLLQTRNREMEKLLGGREGLRTYLGMLWKALRNKFKSNRG